MDLNVTNNLNQQQFEVHANGELAVLQYRFHDKLLWLMHTDVPPLEAMELPRLSPRP
jgi:hypothetical protein